MYNNKYISAKVDVYNGTEFKYKILKDNKHCKYIPIEPKDGNCHAHLSTILLDSILINPNKHNPQIIFKTYLYVADKNVLLGKYIDKS